MLRCRKTQGNVEMQGIIWKYKVAARPLFLIKDIDYFNPKESGRGHFVFVHDLYLILCLRDKLIAAFRILSEL